ncbi:MAG TPA: aminopeptidase N [Planctomycetes bacterium]|nr:aminopeptidase N [Planctomycetota bacterium]
MRLADYAPPEWKVGTVELDFDVRGDEVIVTSRVPYERVGEEVRALRLDAAPRTLRSLWIDGRALTENEYVAEEDAVLITSPPRSFTLKAETRFRPAENLTLEGLYESGGTLCTQCEAEGFRKITPFLDRPDVLTRFKVRIEADRSRFPVLLSNGNPVRTGELTGGRHEAVWEDPHPKPCYLFALVAGDLGFIEDEFTTCSGRKVTLRIYCSPGHEDRLGHAMASLQRAMRWDEEAYGREYDLDLFMIVAVDDFNFGAMENKGLNIFNAALIFADPRVATDFDYQNIERVVGHEYFHNWSGNRVTLRDWFQLSLKEGFTVFREQSFMEATASPSVQRIEQVSFLRSHQFSEDAGPLAHPVRPASYRDIDNFYTSTVYEKGAEIIRMIRNIVGPETFRKGTDLYFERHDGCAVTCEDFVRAIEDASGRDFGEFFRWYEQAGTPRVRACVRLHAGENVAVIDVSQSTAPTPGQPEKRPVEIPLAIGFLGPDGEDLPLTLKGEEPRAPGTRVLILDDEKASWTLEGIPQGSVPSLMRGFSAPVRLEMETSTSDLAFRVAHDSDGFNRWDAGQELALRLMIEDVEARRAGKAAGPDFTPVPEALGPVLELDEDPDLQAVMLILPGETWVAEQMPRHYVKEVHASRRRMRATLGAHLHDRLVSLYEELGRDAFSIEPRARARRRLKNTALALAAAADEAWGVRAAYSQLESASNMTDEMAALGVLAQYDVPERARALALFEERWRHESLVMNKWFAIQASCELPGRAADVRRLANHPCFDVKNPNKVRALLGAFARTPIHFHAPDGSGYELLGEWVERLDETNPQLAARLAATFSSAARTPDDLREKAAARLEKLRARPGLSRNVEDIVDRTIKSLHPAS